MKRPGSVNWFGYVVLPAEVSAFERAYLTRLNRIALWFLAAHIPALTLLALVNQTLPALALLLSSAVFLGPLVASLLIASPRARSVVLGVAAMFMGGLLVHVGQGPVQIEMHFYFFVVLALLAVFANPQVILAASATVALHHLALWFVQPRSVFNYDAPLWVVLVHALFIVMEAVGMCFVARSFFDNVIGLDRIVRQRTAALDDHARYLKLVLDNTEEALLLVDGRLRVLDTGAARTQDWLGEFAAGDHFGAVLGRADPLFGEQFHAAWGQVEDGFLPLPLLLDQLPFRLSLGGRQLDVRLRCVTEGADEGRFLVVLRDVTLLLEREGAERERSESLALVERVMTDRQGLVEFLAEGDEIMSALMASRGGDQILLARALHTLKGNAAVFGLTAVAERCHVIETELLEEERQPSDANVEALLTQWTRFATKAEVLMSRHESVEMTRPEYDAIVASAEGGQVSETLARLRELRLEPVMPRLLHFKQQAQLLASRLGKERVTVIVEDCALRVEPHRWVRVWGALVHLVRNAIDHGIESSDERAELGKKPDACVWLRARAVGPDLAVEVEDDGRGIDWERVRQKALAAGRPAGSALELEGALFADGLSTRDEVTETSGRGVGLSALKAAVEASGGRVEVSSKAGKGTLFRVLLPSALERPPTTRRSLVPGRTSAFPAAAQA